MLPTNPPHHLLALGHGLFAVGWFALSQLTATDVGTFVALSISGVNALAALLSGYAALRTIKRTKQKGEA